MKVVDAQKIHLTRDNWFKSQDDVIRQLARWLNLSVSEERIRAFGKATKDHPALAYDIWLKHERHKQLFTPDQWLKAEQALLDLIERYPDFDRAYASLASSYNTKHFVFPGVFRDQDLHEKALNLALTAVRLDTKSAHGHRAVGYSYALLGQFDIAEHHFRLALELNDNDAWSNLSAASGLGMCGKLKEAGGEIDKLIASIRHPAPDMIAYGAYNKFAVTDYEAVVKSAHHVEGVWFARALVVAAYSRLGDKPKAHHLRASLFQDIRRAWKSNTSPDESEIIRWIVQMAAMSDKEVVQRFADGLADVLERSDA
jgi:tetratricopeptide (TPR) repeat protein